jgi:hypothetical protein
VSDKEQLDELNERAQLVGVLREKIRIWELLMPRLVSENRTAEDIHEYALIVLGEEYESASK